MLPPEWIPDRDTRTTSGVVYSLMLEGDDGWRADEPPYVLTPDYTAVRHRQAYRKGQGWVTQLRRTHVELTHLP